MKMCSAGFNESVSSLLPTSLLHSKYSRKNPAIHEICERNTYCNLFNGKRVEFVYCLVEKKNLR